MNRSAAFPDRDHDDERYTERLPIPPKYVIPPADAPTPKPLFSAADIRLLTRLAKKYGCEVIADAVMSAGMKKLIRRSRVGGRSRGDRPLYEAMALAQWFEKVVEENKQAGSRKPTYDAYFAMWEIMFDPEQQRQRDFDKWRKNIRKRRSLGNRLMRDFRALLRRHPEEAARSFNVEAAMGPHGAGG